MRSRLGAATPAASAAAVLMTRRRDGVDDLDMAFLGVPLDVVLLQCVAGTLAFTAVGATRIGGTAGDGLPQERWPGGELRLQALERPSHQPATSSTTPTAPAAMPCFMRGRVRVGSKPGKNVGNWSAGIMMYMPATMRQ